MNFHLNRLVGLGMNIFMNGYMCLVTLFPASVTKFNLKRPRVLSREYFRPYNLLVRSSEVH